MLNNRIDLLSPVNDDVFVRLVNLDLVQKVWRKNFDHLIPDMNSNVLRGAEGQNLLLTYYLSLTKQETHLTKRY